MISIISPAKTLDFETPSHLKKHTLPVFLDEAQELINVLQKLPKARLAKLMDLSETLTRLNLERYREWRRPFTPENAKPALLAFKGDVYQGFDLDSWKASDYAFAQKHVRILSGLYGVLRPLDLMQPYRLEMGTELKNRYGGNLYKFWGSKLTMALQEALHASRSVALVNLASNEYAKVLDFSQLDVPVVTPVFKDGKAGKFKVVSFFAKRARGAMANYIVRQRITRVAGLKQFNDDGYYFDAASSDETSLVFLRDER